MKKKDKRLMEERMWAVSERLKQPWQNRKLELKKRKNHPKIPNCQNLN